MSTQNSQQQFRDPQARQPGDQGERGGARGAVRPDALGSALGWFGIGLGATELGAPDLVARAIGADDSAVSRTLTRIFGGHKIAGGVGVLGSEQPGRWLWGRVAGDLLDLSALALVAARRRVTGAGLARPLLAVGSVVGVTVLDVIAARRHSRAEAPGHLVHARSSTTIRRAPQDLYRRWHDFESLPTFMYHLDSVRTTDGTSHWKIRGPAGRKIKWDARIVEDRPDELIAWRSVGRSDVRNAGTVRFRPAPGGRGTEVQVDLEYQPPAGAAGVALAKVLGEEPGQLLAEDLRRFKQLMETGEVVRSEASPTGSRPASRLLRQHPARPLGRA
ncbi:putative integral membrane protein [Frankia torreyi]|uniref:Putative integral membrane protein n=1 Tax=Frankia torreyi TaxID=1856 RepID=A0A0D8BAS4_9ACTN|nr:MULTISPECIES: SRPBCC family protein [Frankia]KJE21059.1 putative integral membrane protein [Frankia torreyi]KQC39628.1 cyclase [Frankia sp. ACN1ag]